jgi:hypothetical protein
MAVLALGALCLAALAGGACLVGNLLLPGGLCRGRLEHITLAGVIGLVAAGQLDLVLRLCGWRLTPLALLLLAVAGLAVAARRRRRSAGAAGAAPAARRALPAAAAAAPAARAALPAAAGAAGTRRAPLVRLALLLIAGGTPLLLLALYPPIDPDPGIYHLPFARGFAASSGLPFFASLRFPVFPQLSELLFAAGLRLHGTTGAQLIEVAMALFTALLLWLWGREMGREGGTGSGGEAVGLLAAALWLGNPMVILLGSTAHVDVGLACLVLAGLYCLERERTTRRAAWAALGGSLLGGAAAVKYLGLYFLGGGGAALVLRRRLVMRFTIAALAVVLPVYAHILRLTGNPVFPFLPQVFGYTEWTHDLNLRPEQVRPIPVPWSGATLTAILRFPAQRAAALAGGGTAQLGKLDQMLRAADRDPPHIRALRRLPDWGRAAVLLALAATWVRALWRPPLRLAVSVALSSLLLWLSTLEDVHRLDPRYVLAAAPPIALATAAALVEVVAVVKLAVRTARAGRGLVRLVRPAEPEPARSGPPGTAATPVLAVPAVIRASAASATSTTTSTTSTTSAAIATIAVLAALLPGFIYTGLRCRFLGPLPWSAAAREAVQRRHLPGFAALQEVGRRHGNESTVYGLNLESLAFYAPGRYLGDWFGPARYAKLRPSLGSGEALYGQLRLLGADHLLVPRAQIAGMPHDAAFGAHFQVEHADDGAVLWELRPLPPPPPLPPAAATPALPPAAATPALPPAAAMAVLPPAAATTVLWELRPLPPLPPLPPEAATPMLPPAAATAGAAPGRREGGAAAGNREDEGAAGARPHSGHAVRAATGAR